MTTSAELLIDGFGRVRDIVHRTLKDIDADVLTGRVDPEANTVAWLVWHLVRGQDAQLADASGSPQIWLLERWAEKFGLPFAPEATGYGQTPEEVDAVGAASVDLLLGYLDATTERTLEFLSTVTDSDLDRVVDARWDPPVTLAVRLVSILSDDLQHAGQASYVRGVLERR